MLRGRLSPTLQHMILSVTISGSISDAAANVIALFCVEKKNQKRKWNGFNLICQIKRIIVY